MPLVEFPNGERLELPDDMPEDQQLSMAATYWQNKQKGEMGSVERFGFGAGNVAYGLAQMAAHALPPEARGVMARPLPKLEQQINERQLEYSARKPEGFDIAKLAGEVAATLPLAIAGGGITGGIATGALAGMAQPSIADEDSYWQSKLQQAGWGAAGGAVAGAVGKVIGKVVGGAANPAAKELAAEGITPTLGQSIGEGAAKVEQKLTSFPILGQQIVKAHQSAIDQANVAVYNHALKPIGQKASGEVGPEGVREVFEGLSRAFDDISPKLEIDTKSLIGDLSPIVEQASRDLPPPEMRRFSQLLDQALGKANFKDAEAYLSDYVIRYRGPTAPPDSILLSESLEEVLFAAREGLAKQNPAYASRLRAINEGWSIYAVIRDAAFAAEKRGRDAFSPEEFSQAVANNARRMGKSGIGRFAQGQANLQELSRPMMRVLGKKYPDSGTAGRLMTASMVGGAMGAGFIAPGAMAAALVGAAPYASPLLRRAAAAAVLKRPTAMRVAGEGAEMLGRVSAPGVGLVLAEAGAP